MSNVSPVTAATTGYETQTTTSTLPPKTLSQEDFFQLLIAQMTAQDPMNPLSNAEFMGQMAQFSALEQTRSLETTISKMRNEQQMLQANTLIGRDVSIQDDGTTVMGTVSSVLLEKGVPKVVVDGTAYDLSKVVTISPQAE
jgi:Flagellar hook capping protein